MSQRCWKVSATVLADDGGDDDGSMMDAVITDKGALYRF
jgi:hypothetical protein